MQLKNKNDLKKFKVSQLKKINDDYKMYKNTGRWLKKDWINNIASHPNFEKVKNKISLPIKPKKKMSKKQLEGLAKGRATRTAKRMGLKEKESLDPLAYDEFGFEMKPPSFIKNRKQFDFGNIQITETTKPKTKKRTRVRKGPPGLMKMPRTP